MIGGWTASILINAQPAGSFLSPAAWAAAVAVAVALLASRWLLTGRRRDADRRASGDKRAPSSAHPRLAPRRPVLGLDLISRPYQDLVDGDPAGLAQGIEDGGGDVLGVQ